MVFCALALARYARSHTTVSEPYFRLSTLYEQAEHRYLHVTRYVRSESRLWVKEYYSGTLQDDNTIDVRSLPDGQYVLTLENKETTEVLRTRVLILK